VEECPLADDLRLVAKQELREDDIIRTHSLRAMRNWIRKHPDIVNCRTGNSHRTPTTLHPPINKMACTTM
jgi:hypothetical protein